MKKNVKKSMLLFGIGVISAGLFACKKDDDLVEVPPADVNEAELITTFKILFNDVAGVEPTTEAIFRDNDGDGGNAPTAFDTIRLAASTTYNAEIILLNEGVSPVDTISNEVLEEDDEHLFCFSPSGINTSITRTDTDGTFEVGLQSQWVTSSASKGTTLITLKHQPGVKNGDCAPGETDIELNFVTEIQ